MIAKVNKNAKRQKRHVRVRAKISGTPERPRLNVFRSNANIYAQIIDDVNGVTLASGSTAAATSIMAACRNWQKAPARAVWNFNGRRLNYGLQQ